MSTSNTEADVSDTCSDDSFIHHLHSTLQFSYASLVQKVTADFIPKNTAFHESYIFRVSSHTYLA
jgi:hypothetical protein